LYGDLSAYLTADSGPKTIGFYYSSNNTRNAVFIVINKSNNNTIVYNSTSSQPTGTFTFAVDGNSTYEFSGFLYDNKHGTIRETKTISFYNESTVNGSVWMKTLSGSVMGFQARTIYIVVGMILSLMVMLVTCKPNNYSIGVILGLCVFDFFVIMSWIPVLALIVSVLIGLTVINKIVGGE
jgi:hypothetical protein